MDVEEKRKHLQLARKRKGKKTFRVALCYFLERQFVTQEIFKSLSLAVASQPRDVYPRHCTALKSYSLTLHSYSLSPTG